MKAFVITIMDNQKSVEAATRCMKSAEKYGLHVEYYPAYTPKDKPWEILHKKGISPHGFVERYSRLENCMSCFLSHHSLWEMAVENNETIVIFEHDAIVTGEVPVNMPFKGCMTFSKPSYGKFNTPIKLGVDGLVQKQYFGGAHGYMINPNGAKKFITKALINAGPADTFINLQNFPWLQEYYPWVCIAADNFTTIQKNDGCIAKHNFKDGYEIIDA
jgi:GR25 family glycosyltransferase involved in LPS biosynthesis